MHGARAQLKSPAFPPSRASEEGRGWGRDTPRTEAVEVVMMALGENRRCLLSHKSEASVVCSSPGMSQATAF